MTRWDVSMVLQLSNLANNMYNTTKLKLNTEKISTEMISNWMKLFNYSMSS